MITTVAKIKIRTNASRTHATKRAKPAVLRRKPADAIANDPISRSHGRRAELPFRVTSTKITLTKANGSSAKSRSDRKTVITWHRHNAVAITANPDRRYFRAKPKM